MRARFFLILPLVLMVWFMAENFGLWVYYFILWIIFSAVLFSAVSVIIGIKGIRVDVLSNTESCKRGEEASITIKVSNSSILPFFRVRIKAFLSGTNTKQNRQMHTIALPPKGEALCSIQIDTSHCGKYGLEKCNFRVTDPLGFFNWRIRQIPKTTLIYVLPIARDVENLLPEGKMAVKPTNEHDELAEISLFSEGDVVANINWKQTMRRRELMVSRYETNASSVLHLLIDCRTNCSIDRKTSLTMGDIAGDYAATILKQAIDVERPLKVMILRGISDSHVYRVEEASDIRNIELLFASLQPCFAKLGDGDRIAEEFFANSNDSNSACMVSYQNNRFPTMGCNIYIPTKVGDQDE